MSLYKKYGKEGLKPKSTKPKHFPNKTKKELRNEVIKLKKKEKLCAQKIHWRLNKTKNINISERKNRIWNNYYNNLEHCGLNGKTSNEMLKLK